MAELNSISANLDGNGLKNSIQPSRLSDPQQPHINDNMSMMMILKNTYPELRMNKRKKSQHQEERELEKKTCHGIHHLPSQPGEKFVSKHIKPFRSSAKTSQKQNLSYELHITSQIEFLHPNGIKSSEESQSTSTRSSPPCTMLNLMMRERAAWETLKLCLQSLNPNVKSKLEQSGQQPFTDYQELLLSFSPIKKMSLGSMVNTLKASLQQSIPEHIAKSSSLINQSGIKSQGDKMSYLLTSINSTTSEKLYSTPMELNIREEESLNWEEEIPKPVEEKTKCVGDSTV